MKIDGPLLNATFISRPNRFITRVKINNNIFESHLADPGRLEELLIPGAKLYVRKARKNLYRRTKYSTVMVEHKGELISLVYTLPNVFFQDLMRQKKLSIFKGYRIMKNEVVVKNHRIDFLLSNSKDNLFLEIKSVTFSKKKVAQFPDAITERGKKHILLLTDMVKKGCKAGILFICQRSDVEMFKPKWDRDPEFCKALKNGQKAGLKVWCLSAKLTKNQMIFSKELPIYMDRD